MIKQEDIRSSSPRSVKLSGIPVFFSYSRYLVHTGMVMPQHGDKMTDHTLKFGMERRKKLRFSQTKTKTDM